jgi:hypothetical protein
MRRHVGIGGMVLLLFGTGLATVPPCQGEETAPVYIQNGTFETGGLSGWTADPNWRVDDNSAGGWYRGWGGKWFAWSGEGGEPTTGNLRSEPFMLEQDGVLLWVAGWSGIPGQGFGKWNYVTLNLADGTELDRVYAPDTTVFTPLFLDGGGHRSEEVYVEAVDNAKEVTFSMICIDNVAMADRPPVTPTPEVAPFDPAKAMKLENEAYLIEVTRDHGLITRVRDKVGGIELIREQRLAENFKFTLPIPAHESWATTEANYISGKDQPLASAEEHPDRLVLHWGPPLKNEAGEPFDAAATMTISLVGDEAHFGFAIENQTALEVGEVYYPILGGLVGFVNEIGERRVDPKKTAFVYPAGAGVGSVNVFHTFNNMSVFGVLCPEQYYAYPGTLSMPWVQLTSSDLGRSLYFGAHDPLCRLKYLRMEMYPGISGPRPMGNWPTGDELGDLPAGVRMCWAHTAYNPAGKGFEATPVVLKFHDGDWHEGAEVYRTWFAKHFPVEHGRESWPIPAGAYLQCGRMPFNELPARAAASKKLGVDTLLLSDWKTGGHGDGIPRFEPDPALGGSEGLRDALAECRSLGVQALLRVNVQPVTRYSLWYQEELHRYATTDRWGVVFTVGGWGGGDTVSASMGSGERRAWLSPGAAGWRERLSEQMKALAALGVGGIYLENFSGQPLDFNKTLEFPPDQATWEGGLHCIESMLGAARKENPHFALVVDELRDRLIPYTAVSSSGAAGESPFRMVFPMWRPIASVESGDAFGAVSEAVRTGAQLRIALPIEDASTAELAAYIAETNRLRNILKDLLLVGDYAGETGASVSGGAPYALYADPDSKGRACVVVNNQSAAVDVGFAGFGEETSPQTVTVYAPFKEPEAVSLPATVAVDPGRFVVFAGKG